MEKKGRPKERPNMGYNKVESVENKPKERKRKENLKRNRKSVIIKLRN